VDLSTRSLCRVTEAHSVSSSDSEAEEEYKSTEPTEEEAVAQQELVDDLSGRPKIVL